MNKIFVIKIGSNVFIDDNGVQEKVFANFVDSILSLKKKGISPVIVSSGAIALGEILLKAKEEDLSDFAYECLCASVGQPKLIKMYQDYLINHGEHASQILVTYEDMQDLEKPFMISQILHHNLGRGVVPIVNENNSVFKETGNRANNDKLASFIAEMLRPEKLIFMSSIDGFFDAHPDDGGKLISHIEKIEPKHYDFVSEKKSATGRGGMGSKLEVAEKMINLGIPMYLVNGQKKGILEAVYDGDFVGTRFGL